MLVGYNTNVPYKGELYHVQTEDNGTSNPVIVTLLYIKGTILASKKTSYADLLSDERYKELVREIMKEQHKNMIKELIRGVHTGGETPPESSITEKVAGQQESVPQEEAATKEKIAKSLDDILIDHIIRNGE